jgi:hypothetical protein
MSGKCTICVHEHRHQIEIGLVYHVPMRVLAARFRVSSDAVWRHKRNHLTPELAAAILAAQKPSAVDLEVLQRNESEGLLAQLVAQRSRLQQHGDISLEMGDIRSAVAVERAITSNLELVAKLLGQLVQHHDVRHTSILLTPDYLALRSALVATLRPYPEAAQAVGRALHDLESQAATEIAKRPLAIGVPPQ